MRLIDADSLKDYIDCGHLRPPTELCFSELDVCNMIDKRPTIDAVEVVRCKDCKWWDKDDNYSYGYCMAMKHGYMSANWEIGIYRKYKGDFYCADGERA